MTETGWPLIPREVLPAPVPVAKRPAPPRPAHPADAGRQLPFFGAETTEPLPADLAGLLAGPGRLGRMGGTARVSVVVEGAWRVHVLAAELVMRGLVVSWRPADEQEPAGDAAPPDEAAPPDDQEPADDDSPDELEPTDEGPVHEDPHDELEPTDEGPVGEDPPDELESAEEGPPHAGGPAEEGLPRAGGPADGGPPQARGPADEGPVDQQGPAHDYSADEYSAEQQPADEQEVVGRKEESPDPLPPESSDSGNSDQETTEKSIPRFEVLTAYSRRLNGLAQAWPQAAAKLFLSGPRLRLWVAAAGEPVPGGYALGLDPVMGGPATRSPATRSPATRSPAEERPAAGSLPAKNAAKNIAEIDAALVRAGLAGRLSDDGRQYLIMGKRRVARLAELVGERPEAAPAELWPGGAPA